MHFFKNSVSFIAVMSVCGVALAAVAPARVGVVANAAAMRRLPSLSNVMKSSAATTTTSSSTSGSSTGTGLIDDTECVDNYRDCMKGDNACGSGFEECTTNVLFHGHMSECFSTLYQCSPAAIERLLGTSNLDALSNVDSYVAGTNNSEVARYTYPTDGSVMGMDIIGAATRNKLNTADCVKKYKRCLAKDNVCGEDFELCTSADEFKRQATMCDSTLARCQKEGFQQLFGEKITTKPSNKQLGQYTADGDVHQWVEDGAALAASNAVNTCYKVVDTCFANACAKNPYSCVEDVDWSVVNAAQSIVVGGLDVDTVDTTRTGKQMAGDVRKFFRAACTDTIGSNQYCYMTFNDGKKPTKADLQDEDLREDVFGEAYASRKTILTTKVNELVKKFDSDARNKCIETFKSCAVHSCGGGSGAACYSRVFGNSSTEKSINGANAYSDIENGCAAIVNTDANCRHMAAMQGADTYTFEMGGTIDTFGTLFPKFDGSNNNAPIVSALNADLSTSYNAAAIEGMKKQCSNVVTNCVKSMCGTDYKNCYRNRNDIRLNTYATESNNFNKSMNRVGGVLDYTIVQGLCASTVKSADACAESLAIAKVGIRDGQSDLTMGWGTNQTTLSSAWRNSSANYGYNTTMSDTVPETDNQGRKLCKCQNGGKAVCDSEQGGVIGCSDVSMITRDVQLSNSAVNTLFQEVLADVELEAQAQYKAKLTKEQNVCLAQNTGANPDATFVWAKLKNQNNKLGSDYSINGLGDNGSVASNDLYDSFCRVKVTVQSEDKDIQAALSKGKATSRVYFAVGDPFTCGSWISGDTLDDISEAVAGKKTGTDAEGTLSTSQTWGLTGITALSSIAGIVGTDLLQNKTGLGGLLGTTTIKDYNDLSNDCIDLVTKARNEYNTALTNNNQASMNNAVRLANEVRTKLVNAGVDSARSVVVPSMTQISVPGSGGQSYEWNPSDVATINALITNMRAGSNSGDVVVKTALEGAEFQYKYAPASADENRTTTVRSYLHTADAKFGNKYSSQIDAVNLKAQATSGTTTSGKGWSQADKDKFVSVLDGFQSGCAGGAAAVNQKGNKNFWNNGGGRAVMDVAGGAVVGLAGHFTARKIMEANNRSEFTAAQKEWMENVGSKVHCYVGGELVGDFGDIVTVNITED